MTTTDNKALTDEMREQANEADFSGWGAQIRAWAARIEALTREPSTPSAQAGEGWIRPALQAVREKVSTAEWDAIAKTFSEQDTIIRQLQSLVRSGQPQGDASGQVSGGGEVDLLPLPPHIVTELEHMKRDGWRHVEGYLYAYARACVEAALSSPQARPDGGAVAVVCLTPDAYANGQMAELQVQWTGKRRLQRGDSLYTHPTPAPDAVARLVEAAGELRDLMEATRRGDYTPDSFTVQPIDEALAPFLTDDSR